MLQRDRKLSRLFRILDDAGLTWLTDEVRALCAAAEDAPIDDSEVGSLRAENAMRVAPTPRRESAGSSPAGTVSVAAPGFDACILYVLARIDDVAAYLAATALLAEELGISGVQLGEGDSGDSRHEATLSLLKDVADSARAMVEA